MAKETLFKESYIQGLILQAKQGDRKAFDELWKTVKPYVYRELKPGLDSDTVDDLTSEVCLKLFEDGLAKYTERPGISFVSWLHTFARRVKLDYLETRGEIPLSLDEAATGCEEPDEIAWHNETPLKILIEREEADLRRRALKLLPRLVAMLSPEERFVLYAKYYDNLTDKQVSISMAGDENHAEKYKKMRQRALKKLRDLFARHGITELPGKR